VNQHIYVTGHSGAGKSTRARELAAARGLPIFALDDVPEIVALHEEQKAQVRRTGIFDLKATAAMEHKALGAALARIRALKDPHVVEGSHFLAAPHLLPHDAHVELVDRPKEQILDQRVARVEAQRKLKGKPPDPEGTRSRGEQLYAHYAPGVTTLAARLGTGAEKKAHLFGAFFDELHRIYAAAN